MTNFGVKGAKRSVKMWTTNFYRSFCKNILLYMSSRPPKFRLLHTNVVLWIHWCVANCIVYLDKLSHSIIYLVKKVGDLEPQQDWLLYWELRKTNFMDWHLREHQIHMEIFILHSFLLHIFYALIDVLFIQLLAIKVLKKLNRLWSQ